MKIFRLTFACFIILLFSFSLFSQTNLRENAWREIENLQQEIKKQQKILLSVSDEDIRAYKTFLEQENTGIIRLLPREIYDRKLTIFGGGAYYSFLRKTHEYGYGSDISLEQNYFSVGFAGNDFGVFKALGDVAIENITLKSDGVRELAQFDSPLNPNKNQPAVLLPTPYNSRILAESNKTYALRSINSNQSDIVVVFRSLREDFDGSFVIVWKTLKSFNFENEIKEKILVKLKSNGITDVSVAFENNTIILRGTVPKGKIAIAVLAAHEVSKKPVKNELTEK